MARELIIPFLITANYQTSLAIRQLRGELSQLPAELTALRAAAAEVYAMGAMGLFSLGMLAVGAQQLASSLLAAQRTAALAAVASGQFAAASAVANQILKEVASAVRGTGIDLQSVSAAFLEAARAGLTLQESVALLPQALRLAVVSGGDVSEVFRMTFAIMRNMGIPITKETAKVLTSQLSYALDQSLIDIEDVMHAIKYVGPIAGQLRMPLNDLFAALMMLHDAGIRASIAGTGLARLLVRLQAPTMQARRRLAELGLDWRELQLRGKNLADTLDLLATRVDATTIRLLLGERAERAFYAILQQGTERLRQYSEELRGIGENASYLELKFKALMQTPAFRFQAALQDIRTAGTTLVEPFVKLQLSLLESLATALKAISDSPALRAVAKLAVGFGGLTGTVMLLVSSLSWLIGRFLELGTIGTHFLLVLDRLQASLKSLTLSALLTPIKGLGLGLKTLVFGGGVESLASLITQRLRVSELASTIAQPLVFFRRARRIHPLLQPLPEYLSLQFGSMAAAAAKLGIPLERFLLAGLTFGGMRATIPAFRQIDWKTFLIPRYLQFLESVLTDAEEDLLKAIAKPGASIFKSMPRTLTQGLLAKRVVDTLSNIQASSFADWLTLAQRKIYDAIANQDIILTESELAALGYAGTTLAERHVAAVAFSEQLRKLVESRSSVFKQMIAAEFLALPEIKAMSRVSREAQEAIDELFNRALINIPIESLHTTLDAFYKGMQSAAKNINKMAHPFLMEYQRKVQAVLRGANIGEFTRSLLLGAMALPTDALTEASYLAIGATTGLMAGKVPMKAKQLDRYITDLAKEFSSFMQGITDVTSAAVWLGLSFGASLRKTPPTSVIEDLITARTRTISTLQQLKFLGLASAEQLAALTSAQSELGLLIGMLFSQRLRRLQPQLMAILFSNRLSLDRVTAFYNMVRSIGSGQFKALQEALLGLGLDLPEVIGRLTREGAPFYQQVARELSVLPNATALQQLWMRFSYNVLRAQKAVQMAFTPELTRNLIQSLRAYGLSEKQAAEVLAVMQAGILSVIAERAAAGRELTDIMRRAADIRTGVRVRRWWLRMLRDTFFGREVVKPIVSALSMLPQFMLGKDIAQAIKPAGLLGKVVKGFGIASIVSLIASFILDMIPWDEIARVFNLSTKTKVYLRNLGPGIRTLLWSVLISVGGLLKVITVDFVLGLMDIFRGGQGFLARARNTFSSLAETIANLFVQFMTEVNNQLQMAYAESQIAFTELTTNLVSFSKNLTAGLKSLTQQEQMFYRSLNEAWSILTSSAPGMRTAPVGYESQWREIGKSAVIYADALVNVSEAFRQLQTISVQRSIFQKTFTGIAEAANNVVSNVKLLQQLGVDAWKASSEEFQTRIESLRTSLVGISGLTAKFRTLRNEINKLPPEQRILLAETLAYINKILSYEQALNTAIDNASKVPEKYREKLMQTLSEFAGLLSADQLRASVFDPIREQLEDLQERTNETIKVLKELRDPFVRRELALDIAKQQWEVLTAQHRQMSEVLSAWAELETELRGTTSELMVSAAQSIAAAWNEVLDALQRQRVQSIEEALQLLSSAFELVGDESKEAMTKIAELERLLRQFNFMMLTPEAEREIKKRVAELGKDVLEAFRRIRQALQDEMDEWKQLLEEYTDAFAAMTSDVVDRAITAERRYLNWALIEAGRRAEIMRKLGYSEEQIQEANLRFMSRIATRLYFFRQPTLEQIQQFHSQLAELAESSEDFATAFANRQAAATTSMYRYYRFLELAKQVVQRVGVRTRAFYDYITKAYQSLREAMEMSLDIKVLFFGLHVAWSQVSEVFSSFGESLEDLASKVSMFSLVFNVGVAKIQNLFGQMQKLAVGGIGAFVQRMRIWRQIREIWRTLFPEPSEVADSLRHYSEMLERVVEEGYVPGFLGMTMPQVRQAFMQVLVWLRNFYMQQFQAIAGFMSQVPQWSRVWLELFNAQMRVADALMEIENRLRNIRAEFLSLELFAVPERIGQFLVTQGPALFTFMRTGALGGQSTIQFTIYVNAQDVSAGVQQALAEAQRRLMGFNLQPLF